MIGLAGVVLLAAPDLNATSGWPVAEVLPVAVGYACAPLIAARKLADVPSLPMTTACLGLAGLGVICTACAFIVFLDLIKEVGASRAMVFTYVNPAVAVAAGVALLGEPFTAAIVVSFALILAGCVLAAGLVTQRARPEIQQLREEARTAEARNV